MEKSNVEHKRSACFSQVSQERNWNKDFYKESQQKLCFHYNFTTKFKQYFKYNCHLQVFPLNGVKRVRRNYWAQNLIL